jgi:hypothetical protein
MPSNHNFQSVTIGNDIFVKIDDIIFAFYKEASFAPSEELKNVFGGVGASFELLKRNIIDERENNKQVEEQKKTWWGELAFKGYNKK